MLPWYVIVRYMVWCLVLLSQRLHRVSLFSIHKVRPLHCHQRSTGAASCSTGKVRSLLSITGVLMTLITDCSLEKQSISR